MPPRRQTPRTLGIVADDLTGAMDSSGLFAAKRLVTEVLLDSAYVSKADVVVITTDSRAADADFARQRVREAVKRLAGRLIYKKIDSTLRGNIGAELLAAKAEAGYEKVIVAPSFPAVGRTTAGGVLLVNGVPVAQTSFANDPVSPVKESHIPTLLERATGRKAGCVSVQQIEAGEDALYEAISLMPEEFAVCDVTQQGHIETIVRASALAQSRWLLSGSGGMARELHALLPRRAGARTPPPSTVNAPALAVIGTRNPVAMNQLRKAEAELRLPIVRLAVERLDDEENSAREVQRVAEEAGSLLIHSRSVALTSIFAEYAPTMKSAIPSVLAEAVRRILATHRLGGIFLSGGDIAVAICRKMSVSAIRVHGEVEPGIPAGATVGGQTDGLRIVTKAGGFGTELTLVKSMAYLEKGLLK